MPVSQRNAKTGKIELFAKAARTTAAAAAVSATYSDLGWVKDWIFVLDYTDADTIAGDTLDVFVDFSIDGETWVNAVHFTQILGNGADAGREIARLSPGLPTAAVVVVTSDAASGVTRPGTIGSYMRGRYALVNGGGAQNFDFGLVAYGQA